MHHLPTSCPDFEDVGAQPSACLHQSFDETLPSIPVGHNGPSVGLDQPPTLADLVDLVGEASPGLLEGETDLLDPLMAPLAKPVGGFGVDELHHAVEAWVLVASM